MTTLTMTPQEREQLALLYAVAFERGDVEAVAQILAYAEQDDELDNLLADLNLIQAAEHQHAQQSQAIETVRQLLREHLSSAFATETEVILPPLTVGDVAAKLKTQVAQRGATRPEVVELTRQLQNNPELLPMPVRLPEVRRLLKQLGLSASAQFEKLFQETATFLAMGRGQSLMAATRRQKSAREAQQTAEKKA